MPFQIIRNDIANMRVDAIVNPANPKPVIGYGVEAGLHQKAGPELLKARQRIGNIRVGDAAITSGFQLPAKHVIHAVTPVWQGGEYGEAELLLSCYKKSLKLARLYGCKSIAFPLMSAGNHGFPKPLALQIAMDAISSFLLKHEIEVYLVVFSREAFQLSEKLFHDVSSFIDENYIQEKNLQQYGLSDKCMVRGNQQAMVLQEQMRRRMEEAFEKGSDCCPPSVCPPSQPKPQAKKASKRLASPLFSKPQPKLEDLLKTLDAGFSETLLKLIDQTGKKDSEIYKKANVTKQHFSKIRNNPDYKPTKATALAFAIALELDLEQTNDLIGRAGYALTNSSKFDVIITYFIRQRNYNIMDINMALFQFDQATLGV